MTEEEIQSEITIQCAPWKADKGYLQFCHIRIGGRQIEVPRIDSKSLSGIAIAATAECGHSLWL